MTVFGKQVLKFLLLVLIVFAGIRLVQYGIDRYYRAAYPMHYVELIEPACAQKGLNRALVYAVVRTESGFDTNAESYVGAKGLMQLMPDAFAWVQMRKGETEKRPLEQLYDPSVNIEYGTEMLRLLSDEFVQDETVLCAYHAGWSKTKDWLENPEYSPDGVMIEQIPYQDTAAYVKKVIKTMEIYRKLYDL